MKQWHSSSGQPTNDTAIKNGSQKKMVNKQLKHSQVDFQRLSYFEKMERLKRQIQQTHSKAQIRDIDKISLKTIKTDALDSKDGIQPPNPDWSQACEEERKMMLISIPESERNAKNIIKLDEYLANKQ